MSLSLDRAHIVLLKEIANLCKSVLDGTFEPRTKYAITQAGREDVAVRILKLLGEIK
jgi:hypothetical protein